MYLVEQSHDLTISPGVDTRELTKKIREEGTILGRVVVCGDEEDTVFEDPNIRNLVQEVSCQVCL